MQKEEINLKLVMRKFQRLNGLWNVLYGTAKMDMSRNKIKCKYWNEQKQNWSVVKMNIQKNSKIQPNKDL